MQATTAPEAVSMPICSMGSMPAVSHLPAIHMPILTPARVFQELLIMAPWQVPFLLISVIPVPADPDHREILGNFKIIAHTLISILILPIGDGILCREIQLRTAGLGASGETAIRGKGLVNAGYFISDSIGIIAAANPDNGAIAMYSEGNTYTTGVQATIISSDDLTQRKAINSISSQDVEIMLTGNNNLIGGECRVTFDEEFLSLISSEIPFRVIITPGTSCEYPIAVDKRSDGFIAKEMMEGSSDGAFDWIVIARRKGFESRPELPENLAAKDFDEKMYLRNFDQSKDPSPKYSHSFFFPTPPPRAEETNPDIPDEHESNKTQNTTSYPNANADEKL